MNEDCISRAQLLKKRQRLKLCGAKIDVILVEDVEEAPALEMTQSQKPLTLDEVRQAEYVYLEDNDKEETIVALVEYTTDSYIMFRVRGGRNVIGSFVFYGKRWRVWVRRPTDEEREAAAWEE